MRTRVKMCGFTRTEDIKAAVQAGADAVGLVFYEKSKRYVSIAQAAHLRAHLPAFVQSVALFVNAKPAFVRDVMHSVKPDLLQFHGEESPAYCESFDHPYMRAFRVGAPGLETAEQLLEQCRRYSNAQAWLFDSYSPAYGGSGTRFDLQLLEHVLAHRKADEPEIILAGGVTPDRLPQLMTQIHPYALDVSSAIEDAPGMKNAAKMQAFMKALNF
ncbi:MAG TPA: phosphoribosylanthranilate isomerase [Paenalcaligenes hominis]|uniref:N-(5'-phosphoribosyl)anthranilate isomerase n=1 Tax=Paenalcaligenes hominis TaxID=643674 RepID=A0A9D2VHN7_9BURK|nr:phosphoribosylanthranilate isomerase [Paenalcaligenes hominis]NJB64400.1 phosphoribosylanthranilate isomerase [Paenalcaligenes hominis]GGE67954.1 N-(5'-phosphoribosyl)anthranilate isomerase [Paenalcaligenes hominis]HJH24779.1 phosphoribosylanthranilate isomerase [Paenalcaligenes hominis]